MDVILYSKLQKIKEDLEEFKDGWGEGEEIHMNLLDSLTPTSTTQYYNVTNNGSLALSSSSTKTYTSYMIPAKENQQYTMSYQFRYVIPLNESQVPLVTKAYTPSQITTINTSDYPGCKYLAVSIDNVYPPEGGNPVAISEGDTARWDVITIAQDLPGWCKDKFDEVEAVIAGADIKKKKNKVFMLTGDSFSEEISFSEFASSVKGVSMSLVVNPSSFTSVTVGLKTSSIVKFYAEITDTAINLYDYGTGTPTTTSYNHGLTIADNLSVDIYPNENTSNYFVKIASNGSEYTIPSRFTVSHVGLCYPFASMVGTASFVQFSATCDVNRPIWVFGDSYLGTNNVKRWAYYLVSNDKDSRVVLDGYAGENSESAFASLETLIKMDTPDYIVWCLGMNDGGDSGTTPKPIWLEKIQAMIELCEEENIIPILATIPTVPSVNNEGKNAWVRESGYQYIDFAKAVNANSSGVWFTGMLDTDNVHPTQTGAVTLYHAALAGCPQFNQK